MNYLFAILILGAVILIHEAGHFLFARLSDVPVKRFSIGFGPKLLGFRKRETEFILSAVPVGGYVMPAIEDEKDFFGIPIGKRLLFTIGGPLVNILASVLILSILNTLQSGFSLRGFFLLPLFHTADLLGQIILGFASLFTQPQQLTGAVGIVSAGSEFIEAGIVSALTFGLIINLNLAVLNLLPLPPLDGGKILLYLLEKIDRRLVKLHIPVAVTGWLLLIGLVIYSTYADIGRLMGAA